VKIQDEVHDIVHRMIEDASPALQTEIQPVSEIHRRADGVSNKQEEQFSRSGRRFGNSHGYGVEVDEVVSESFVRMQRRVRALVARVKWNTRSDHGSSPEERANFDKWTLRFVQNQNN
jgi:hypothetical protein